ncbi:MAG: RagB/SusD family nutrient uptake outer membrane protein [Cyclobacteriaceae bacterium]
MIVQANTIMYNINHYATSAVTPATKQHALAECRYMRALALSYLVMNYGPIPIVDENYVTTLIESGGTGLPQLKRNTVPSVWKFIVKDFRYAAQNLEKTAPQTGRLTSWSAEGMLARTYLNIAGVNQNGADGLNGTLNST